MIISFNDLNIYNVENLYKDILEELNNSSVSLILDFENVEKVDLSSIQLLISTKKYCDIKNINFNIININSKKIKQSFKMFSLYKTLGIEV